MPRDPREYGLNSTDREFEIRRKFGDSTVQEVLGILGKVSDPTEQVLGAIVFLAREHQMGDFEELISLANEDRNKLLHAAAVKDERG